TRFWPMSPRSGLGSIAVSERPMSAPLLDRQLSLLEHLTSGAAIFDAGGPAERAPSGIPPALLRLEARFSHEKRMTEIKWVLSRTFEAEGSPSRPILPFFLNSLPASEHQPDRECPPVP